MRKSGRLYLSVLLGFVISLPAISAEPGPASRRNVSQSQDYRHRIEQMFGKYFGSYQGFDIYGVVKHDGSWDRADDSTVKGVIVAPEGSKYSQIALKAELKFNGNWLYGNQTNPKAKPVTQTITATTDGSGWDCNKLNIAPSGQKPLYKEICHTSFAWECPRSVDQNSLRITDLIAR